MKDEVIDFLLCSYFGIKSQEDVVPKNEKDRENLILKCARRAYQDLCRTLRFRESPNAKGLGKAEKERIERSHGDFCDKISKMIRDRALPCLLTATDEVDFNDKHQKVCAAICKEANGTRIKDREDTVLKKRFYDGQAQKWLNMTIKYMWLLGLLGDQMKEFLSVVHVPVDNDVIKKAIDMDVKPSKKTWSTWSYEEYEKFQKDLKDKLAGEPPLKWENRVWMEGKGENCMHT